MWKKYLLMQTKLNPINLDVFCILPYFVLMALPIIGFVGVPTVGLDYLFSTRLMGLLWSSLKLGATSSFLCVLVGLKAALAVRSTSLYNKKTRWFFLAFSPIPYYIYALSFMYMVRYMLNISPTIARSMASGFFSCIFVNLLSFLPIATGLILMELERLDIQQQELALLYYGWNDVVFKIIIPSLRPIITVAGMLIFILSVTDFSVPSLFQYNTFTLEIFSSYSKGLDLTTVGFISLPLIMIVLAVASALVVTMKRTAIYKNQNNNKKIHTTGILRWFCKFGLLVCLIQIIVPTVTFAYTAGDFENIMKSIEICWDEFTVSVMISAYAGGIAVGVTLPLVLVLHKKINLPITILALVPLAMPSSLIAMGLLSTVNGSIIHNMSRSVIFPALGCGIKYMPFVFLSMMMYQKHMDMKKIEIARCYMRSKITLFFCIILPMYLPILVGSFLMTFLLSMGEEGIGLILMPPGYQTLAVMIYNYLHYGASQLVSGFCLLTVVMTLLLTIVMIGLFDWRGKHKER